MESALPVTPSTPRSVTIGREPCMADSDTSVELKTLTKPL